MSLLKFGPLICFTREVLDPATGFRSTVSDTGEWFCLNLDLKAQCLSSLQGHQPRICVALADFVAVSERWYCETSSFPHVWKTVHQVFKEEIRMDWCYILSPNTCAESNYMCIALLNQTKRSALCTNSKIRLM